MSSAESRGQFVWHELVTTDIAGAGAFYPRVAGWKTQAWDKNSSYTLWVGSAGPMGGVMPLPEEAPASSHWMPYIAAPDMAGTFELARRLGGTVCTDVTEIPGAGSYAVLQDPQGAAFAIYCSTRPQDNGSAEESGFSWHELATGDFDAALQFYMQLFGWGKGPTHDMGDLGYYQIFTRHGKNMGGIYKMPPGVTTPHWLSYVRVNDVDEAARAAKAAGGRVVNGPMEVPGGDWIAQIIDPQGAAFAVHQLKAAAKPAAARKAKAVAASPKRAVAAKSAARKRVAAKAKPAARRKSVRKSKSAAAKRAGASRRASARKRVVKKAARRAVRQTVRKVARKKSSRRLRAKRRR